MIDIHRYCSRYRLESKPSRICPKCRVGSMYLYRDNEGKGEPLNDAVGRCSRLFDCQYDYTPQKYFGDNPSDLPASYHSANLVTRQLSTIPADEVKQSLTPNNTLVCFLQSIFDYDTLAKLMQCYLLGSTQQREVIYWQVDEVGLVRSGKVMNYDSYGNREGRTDWMHSRMMRERRLGQDWELTQCLFGLHLINRAENRDKTICVVEGEKSAVICSVIFPQYVWLATGGLSNINTSKFQPLKGRDVILFPDLNGLEQWSEKAQELKCCKVTISDFIFKYDQATRLEVAKTLHKKEGKEDGLDIADFVLCDLMARKAG